MATLISNEVSGLLGKYEITVEILPEKKGYIKRHVEYEVYSSQFNSQVLIFEKKVIEKYFNPLPMQCFFRLFGDTRTSVPSTK